MDNRQSGQRRLRRPLALALASAILVTCGCGQGPAHRAGVLRVHPGNPRYFTDDSGKAIYMTGSHMWNDFQDWGQSDPPPKLDHSDFLKWLKQHNHNFIRGWVFENTQFPERDPRLHMGPELFVRTGPGTANDGKPRFDLTKVNPLYLARVRQRVVEAGRQGIYVGVMLFEPINYGKKRGAKPPPEQQAWYFHPFHRNNNINRINGDPNGDGEGWETSTLSTDTFFKPPIDPSVTALQERYAEAVIDALHDLDNLMWEIGNESILKSNNWQDHLIKHVQSYEQRKGYTRHLVWKTAMDDLRQGQYVNKLLFNSPAEVISPNRAVRGQDYRSDPPAADGSKIIIADTDHLWGVGGDVAWVWKSFMRGIHPIFMDPYHSGPWSDRDRPGYEAVRRAMGHTRRYAERINLAAMTPQPADSEKPCSTRYCLFNDGREYLAYQPESGSFAMSLPGGRYNYEWFNLDAGTVAATGSVAAGEADQTFEPPFKGPAVLWLHR